MNNSNVLCEINQILLNKYRLLYSPKEIKICIVIDFFIYYIVDNKEKYDIELPCKEEIIARCRTC